MHCPQCGDMNREEDTYCGRCGSKLPHHTSSNNNNSYQDPNRIESDLEDTKKFGDSQTQPTASADQKSTYARPEPISDTVEIPVVSPGVRVPAPDGEDTAKLPAYLAPPRPNYDGARSARPAQPSPNEPRRMAPRQETPRTERPQPVSSTRIHRDGPGRSRPGHQDEQRKDKRFLGLLIPALAVLLIATAFLINRFNSGRDSLPVQLATTSNTSDVAALPLSESTTVSTNDRTEAGAGAETTTDLVIRYVSGTPTPMPETTESTEETTEATTEETTEATTEETTTAETTEETTPVPTTEEMTTATSTTTEPITTETATTTETTMTEPLPPVLINDPDLTIPENAETVARDSGEAAEVDRIMNMNFGFGNVGSGDQFRRIEIRGIDRDPNDSQRLFVEYYIFEYIPQNVIGDGASVPYYKIYSNEVLVGVATIDAYMGSIGNAYNLPQAQRVYLNQLAETDVFLSEIKLEEGRLVSATSRMMPGVPEALARLNRLDASTGARIVTVARSAPLYSARSTSSQQIGTLAAGNQVGALPFGNDDWMFIVDSEQNLVGYALRERVE